MDIRGRRLLVAALVLCCGALGAGDAAATRESKGVSAPTFALTLEVRLAQGYTAGVPSSFTVIVTNHGPIATTGTTKVYPAAQLPNSFESITADGSGWTCGTGIAAQCTTTEVVAAGATFAPLTYHFTPTDSSVPVELYVMGVAALAGSENTVDNTSGCITVAPASDPATPRADLSVDVISPVAGFSIDVRPEFSIVVTNNGPVPTTGSACVSWFAPKGAQHFATNVTGGWTCGGFCWNDTVIPAGGSYPPVIVTFTFVASDTPSVNSFQATVSNPWESAPDNDTRTVPMIIVGGLPVATTTTSSPTTIEPTTTSSTTTAASPLSQPGTPLPKTGASSSWRLSAALGLVVLGGAALMLSRRSRSSI